MAPVVPQRREGQQKVSLQGVPSTVIQLFQKKAKHRQQSSEQMSLFRVDILRSQTKVDPQRLSMVDRYRRKYSILKNISEKLKNQ